MIYLEEVLRKSDAGVSAEPGNKNPVMVAAGKKAALARAIGTYTFYPHIHRKPEAIQQLGSPSTNSQLDSIRLSK